MPTVQQIPTLVSLAEESIAIRQLAPRTKTSYQDIIDTHIRPQWGNRLVTDITFQELQAWLSEIATKHPALAHRIHVVIRQAIRLALIDDLVSKNIADYIRLPRPPKKDVVALTPQEFQAAAAEITGTRDRLIIEIMAVGGLRFCEVAGLRTSSVTPTGLIVDRSITPRRGGGFNIGSVKNHQARKVQLPKGLLIRVRNYADSQESKGSELLFANTVGRPLDIGNWNSRVLRPACERAKIPTITAHILRHTSATTALHAGVPVHVVAKHLGHADGGVTFAHYAGTWNSKLTDLADIVGSELLEFETSTTHK